MKKILLALCLLISFQLSAQNQATFFTPQGNFVVEMYNIHMPATTTNFEGLVQAKFYDSILFHRIIANFVIQGGDPTTRGGSPSPVIQDEFDATKSNLKYTLSMANAGPNTGSSQFFINLKNNTFLDFDKLPLTSQHPVFGEVISGQAVVDALGLVPTDTNDKPITDIRIDSVRMTYITPVGTNDVQSKNFLINISPNPISQNSTLNIELSRALKATLTLTNIEGKELFKGDKLLTKGLNKINMNDLKINIPGLYFIRLQNNEFSSTKKLLIQQ